MVHHVNITSIFPDFNVDFVCYNDTFILIQNQYCFNVIIASFLYSYEGIDNINALCHAHIMQFVIECSPLFKLF